MKSKFLSDKNILKLAMFLGVFLSIPILVSATTYITDSYIKTTEANATQFYGKFNWTTADNWNSFDGSTLDFNESMLSTTYYNVTQYDAIAGSISGTIGLTQHSDGNYDGITLNITESSGSPALDIRFNFTGVSDFNNGIMRYYTSDLSGRYPVIQLWNYVDNDWDDYPVVSEIDSFRTINQPVFNPSESIQDNVIQMRIYKASNGNTNNKYYVDWIAVAYGYGTPSGEETDPYSIHRDGNVELTDNWDVGGYNITASWFFGNLNSSYIANEYWIDDSDESNLNVNSSQYLGNYQSSDFLKTSDESNLDVNSSNYLDNYDSSDFVLLSDESNLNVNSSNYWDNYDSPTGWDLDSSDDITTANIGDQSVNNSAYLDGKSPSYYLDDTNCSADGSCSAITYDSETTNWDKDSSDDITTSNIANQNVNSSNYWDNYDSPSGWDLDSSDDITTSNIANQNVNSSDYLDNYDSTDFILTSDESNLNVNSSDYLDNYDSSDFLKTSDESNLDVNSSSYWNNWNDPSGWAGDYLSWSGTDFDVSDSWWNSISDVPTASPSNGDTTHLSTADQIYDFVTGQGYLTSSPFGSTIDDTELTAEDFGDFTCDGSEDGCTLDNSYILTSDEGNLNVNSSSYWDNLNSPSDISTGDLTDDNTYVRITGDTMHGNLGMEHNVIQNIGNAGTDFTATGGLNLADTLAVSDQTDNQAVEVTSGDKICLDGATCSHYMYYNGTHTIIV